ncbi:MAG: Nramp family divalent metal transporter [Pseudomonadota bacterium]
MEFLSLFGSRRVPVIAGAEAAGAELRAEAAVAVSAIADAPRPASPARRLMRVLGPGLVTGASDDDPSGIATYSQVGAQFGYAMGWAVLLSYPLMAAIQEVSARIGCVTGRGIAANIRRYYSPGLLRFVVALLLAANIVNLGADIGAMGSALSLLIGGPVPLYALGFGLLCILLQIFCSYARYAAVLKWLSLSLLAYVAAMFAAQVSWRDAFAGTFMPRLEFGPQQITALVALLGTTISPYLFFWQSSQEVEELRSRYRVKPLAISRVRADAELKRIRLDTLTGMGFANLIALFIMVTSAATLHAHGITAIASSAEAAEALRPIAGPLTSALFAAGIVGTGLLAVPVLAGSAAYALGEACRWPVGLARRPTEAKAFYGTIAVATLLGVALNAAPLDPIRALYWAAVVNGVLAPPLMAVMMVMASNPKIMGRLALPLSLRIAGWAATAVMGLTVAGMLLSWLD